MRDLPAGTVTFLFTDVEGSTKLLHELGAEAYADALADHRRLIRAACAAEGGAEVDTQGDAFFFAFPTAPGALAAADAMTKALSDGPIQVRIGLHTGQPLLTDEGYIGDDVHFGARVASSGHGGQVVLSRATADLVALEVTDLGEHRLKDIPEAVPIFQLGDGSFAPLKTISNTNLPRPASSFVGREDELLEVLSRFEDGARLVTLTGPGGTGKTRLAIEAAASLVPEYKAGVFWVGLATLRDPALVTETIAQTLGATDGLAEHIGDREMLLLLDNLEQVIDAAPELSGLLSACPCLTLLVTSRELLRIQGEVEYAVPPLAEREAVSLFCERSRLESSEAIVELCSRLDSLPLAVELAAARTSALTPEQIVERLSQRLDLLKGGRDADPRQLTLRTTIEWSYGLLSDDEKQLFARLSVFAGGCTLEAAEEVCDADLDTLQSLVEKSLLRFTDRRYWMLETIREFAIEALRVSQGANEIARKHAEHYATFVEEHRDEIRDSGEAHRALRTEVDNLREALEWALEAKEGALGAIVIGATWPFWIDCAMVREGLDWSRRVLPLTEGLPPAERLDVLHAVGEFTRFAGDFENAERLKSEELELARHVPPETRVVALLCELAQLAGARRDFARAEELSAEAHRLALGSGEDQRIARVTALLGLIRFYEGRYAESRDHYRDAVRLWERVGSAGDFAGSILMCGQCSRRLGDLEVSSDELRRAIDLFLKIDERYSFPECLQEVGGLCLAQRHFELAASLLGAAERHRRKLGVPLWDPDDWQRIVAAARSALCAEHFEEHWNKGASMTLDEAMDAAVRAID